MARFTDLLQGFGYRVAECTDPTQAVVAALANEHWDLVVLAVGAVEILSSTEDDQRRGRKVVLASFGDSRGTADELLTLDGKVIYEAGRSRL